MVFPRHCKSQPLTMLVQTILNLILFFHNVPFLNRCMHILQGDLGYLYLDLYSREGKYPGCANFAIKGARRISDTEYQLPVC